MLVALPPPAHAMHLLVGILPLEWASLCAGRDAPASLVEAADLVTETRKVEHPFERGVRAQPGIDF